MRIVYEYRLDDVIAHTERIAHTRAPQMRLAGLMVGTIFVALAIALYAKRGAVAASLLVGAVGVAFSICWMPYLRRHRRRMLTKFYSGSSSRSVFGERVADATPEHLHVVQANGIESTIPWTAIDRIEETDARLWIYFSPVDAFIVPRDSVSAGDFDAFVAFCREHVGRRSA